MTTEMIKDSVLSIVNEYPIKKIILFGSRAEGIHREDSDVDLIMEFSMPVSLLTLSMIKLKETDLIEIGKVVELYAA